MEKELEEMQFDRESIYKRCYDLALALDCAPPPNKSNEVKGFNIFIEQINKNYEIINELPAFFSLFYFSEIMNLHRLVFDDQTLNFDINSIKKRFAIYAEKLGCSNKFDEIIPPFLDALSENCVSILKKPPMIRIITLVEYARFIKNERRKAEQERERKW